MQVHEIPLSKMFYTHRETPLLDSTTISLLFINPIKKMNIRSDQCSYPTRTAYLNMMENSHLHSYVAFDTLR